MRSRPLNTTLRLPNAWRSIDARIYSYLSQRLTNVSILLYTGWYDFVYENEDQLCLGTCKEQPEAMWCKKEGITELNGRKYCSVLDCKSHSDDGRDKMSGCHQERDFHDPTCFECSIVFATACESATVCQDGLDRC